MLPVRFGTVMANDRSVAEELLEPQAERLSARLRDLAGRVQLSVKGEYDETALLREVVDATPAVKALRERVGNLPDAAGYYDRIRLGELVAAEVERRRASDAALAVERLSGHAVATETSEPKTPNGAFDLAFLVERGGIDTFSAAVGDLSADARGRGWRSVTWGRCRRTASWTTRSARGRRHGPDQRTGDAAARAGARDDVARGASPGRRPSTSSTTSRRFAPACSSSSRRAPAASSTSASSTRPRTR